MRTSKPIGIFEGKYYSFLGVAFLVVVLGGGGPAPDAVVGLVPAQAVGGPPGDAPAVDGVIAPRLLSHYLLHNTRASKPTGSLETGDGLLEGLDGGIVSAHQPSKKGRCSAVKAVRVC